MKIKEIRANFTWQRGYALAAWALFALILLRVLLPLRATDLLASYGLCIIFAMLAIYFYKRGLSGPIEVKLLLVYLAWVLLTRLINRDFYLLQDYDYVMTSLLCFLFFIPGLLLEGKDRELLLDAVSLPYIILHALGSIAGIFVAISNTYIHIPPENVWITMITISGLDRLNLFSHYPLFSAIRLFTVWAAIIYQITRRKNIFVRVLLVIAAIAVHIALGIDKARTSIIGLSVAFALLCMLLTMHFFAKKLGKLNFAVLPLVALLSLLLCYKSFDYSNLMISKLHGSFAPRFEEYYESSERKLDPEYFGIVLSAENKVASKPEPSLQALRHKVSPDTNVSPQALASSKLMDNRSVLSNFTLSGRTYIWEGGLKVIKDNPKIALFGSIERTMMDKVNEANTHSKTEFNHMHNFLMQAMVSLGIPGFLILLCWVLVMVKDMVQMFFSTKPGYTLERKILMLMVAGIFVINMCTVNIFGQLDLAGIVFFLFAGVFTSYYYDQGA